MKEKKEGKKSVFFSTRSDSKKKHHNAQQQGGGLGEMRKSINVLYSTIIHKQERKKDPSVSPSLRKRHHGHQVGGRIDLPTFSRI